MIRSWFFIIYQIAVYLLLLSGSLQLNFGPECSTRIPRSVSSLFEHMESRARPKAL